VPVWKCGCARTGQLTATRAARGTRATRATRATHLIPTALGSPPGAANREGASQIAGLIQVQPFGCFHPSDRLKASN
jgi:hypothetical protein